jgi:hypothetical protein
MTIGTENKEKAMANQEKLPIFPGDIIWIVVLALYMTILGVLFLWALIAFFPSEIPNGEAASTISKIVVFMGREYQVSDEVRMILLVGMAGALGSLVHGFRSLFWYVGNRAFARSWVLMYFLLPFIGSSLSIIFYFVLRGGLFSPNATVGDTSSFGFVGVAGLVGMFSNRAALKLQEVAESIFSTKESTKGKDNVDSKTLASETKTEKNTKTSETKTEENTEAKG